MASAASGGPVIPDAVFGRNKLIVIADLANASFNGAGTHRLGTVSGIVQVTTVFQITEDWASGGALTANFGYSFDPDSYSVGAIALANLVNGRFVSPGAGATTTVVNLSALLVGTNANMVMLGQHIGYRINAAAATDGLLRAIMYWTPISPGASIVAAGGGAL